MCASEGDGRVIPPLRAVGSIKPAYYRTERMGDTESGKGRSKMAPNLQNLTTRFSSLLPAQDLLPMDRVRWRFGEITAPPGSPCGVLTLVCLPTLLHTAAPMTARAGRGPSHDVYSSELQEC